MAGLSTGAHPRGLPARTSGGSVGAMIEFSAHTRLLATSLSGRRLEPPAAPPHDGSRTSAALAQAHATWSRQLTATDESVSSHLDSLGAFLAHLEGLDGALAHELGRGLPGPAERGRP